MNELSFVESKVNTITKNKRKLEISQTSPMVTIKAGIATDKRWLAVLSVKKSITVGIL